MKKSRYKDDLLVKRNFKPLKKEDLMTNNNLPRGGFGLEKAEMNTFKDEMSLKTKDSNNLNDKSIQCHTCKHNMICKYQGDYLEQIVHIVDSYNRIFELNCCHYKNTISDNKISDEVINQYLSFAINTRNHKMFGEIMQALKSGDQDLLKKIIYGDRPKPKQAQRRVTEEYINENEMEAIYESNV